MAADALVRLRVADATERPDLAWAEGMEIVLPADLIERLGLVIQTDGRCVLKSSPLLAESLLPSVDELRERAAFTERPPASSRMPISYQRIPSWARTLVGSVIGRIKRRSVAVWGSFPRWPLDLSVDFLTDLVSGRPSPISGGPTPVLLSHDLDSPEGLRNFVERFAGLEERLGARSVNYIVPRGWPIDEGLLGEVARRGHEVGIHGYDHGNQTPFTGTDEMRTRLAAARDLIERYGCKGYRAPSLLRTRTLLRELRPWYAYDSSIPSSGGLFPIPNNGCASARPFVVEGIREIPVTLPRDGSLRFLGHSPDQIYHLWVETVEQISRSGGVVMLLTHCEQRFTGNPKMLEAYRRFLEFLAADSRFAWATPKEVLRKCFSLEADPW